MEALDSGPHQGRVFWKSHWSERSTRPQEMDVCGRPSNQPSELLQMVSGIVRHLSLHRQDIVLDAGCANGLISLALAPWVREIWACDFVPGMLSQARHIQSGHPNIRLFAADVRRLPLRSVLFTKALLVGVIQCLQDRSEILDLLAGLRPLLVEGAGVWVGWLLDAESKVDYLAEVDRLSCTEETKEQIRFRNQRALWIARDDFRSIARKAGFACEVLNLAGSAWQGGFMYDAVLSR